MNRVVTGFALGDALVKAGFYLPPETADIKILTPIDGVLQVQYTVNILEDDLPKLAEAFRLLKKMQSTIS